MSSFSLARPPSCVIISNFFFLICRFFSFLHCQIQSPKVGLNFTSVKNHQITDNVNHFDLPSGRLHNSQCHAPSPTWRGRGRPGPGGSSTSAVWWVAGPARGASWGRCSRRRLTSDHHKYFRLLSQKTLRCEAEHSSTDWYWPASIFPTSHLNIHSEKSLL